MKEKNVQPVKIHYVNAGDYSLPELELLKINNPIGRYGRMRKSTFGNTTPLLTM